VTPFSPVLRSSRRCCGGISGQAGRGGASRLECAVAGERCATGAAAVRTTGYIASSQPLLFRWRSTTNIARRRKDVAGNRRREKERRKTTCISACGSMALSFFMSMRRRRRTCWRWKAGEGRKTARGGAGLRPAVAPRWRGDGGVNVKRWHDMKEPRKAGLIFADGTGALVLNISDKAQRIASCGRTGEQAAKPWRRNNPCQNSMLL